MPMGKACTLACVSCRTTPPDHVVILRKQLRTSLTIAWVFYPYCWALCCLLGDQTKKAVANLLLLSLRSQHTQQPSHEEQRLPSIVTTHDRMLRFLYAPATWEGSKEGQDLSVIP